MDLPGYWKDDFLRTVLPMEEPFLWSLRIALSNLVKN